MYISNAPNFQHINSLSKFFDSHNDVEVTVRQNLTDMDARAETITNPNDTLPFNGKERSDRLINYFLIAYFLLGLVYAPFYDTWLVAVNVGGVALMLYYGVKMALPNSRLYQYVLAGVLGVFMAQFIYQMHGMNEMHFFAFIGSAILITYQNWKLQLPLVIVVVLHHLIFNALQNAGHSHVYFTEGDDLNMRTLIIHSLLACVIFFICGFWSYQLKKQNELQMFQAMQMAELQKKSQLSLQRKQHGEERNNILESIGDAFFAVDKNWTVTYWNYMAEKILNKTKKDILNRNLWQEFSNSTDSLSYKKYHEALQTRQPVHFEDYYAPLNKWYEISAYPTDKGGLSVYFKDITERKESELMLISSEKKYSELFHLSPIPMWVFDLDTLEFLDVNVAALKNYGYTRDEFLNMSLRDIRPAEDIHLMEEKVDRFRNNPGLLIHGIYRHKRKNGEIIQADIQSYDVPYKGKNAKVILADDVTERLNYINEIKEQNDKLKEISWMQSHIIRAPLARIMGLIPLIENYSESPEEKDQMLQYMLLSAHELDDVIRNIVHTAMEDVEGKMEDVSQSNF